MKAITIRDTLRKLIRPRRTRQAPRPRSFLPRLEALEDRSVPSAVVTSVSPAFGPTSGGTGVAIRGSGFTGASAVAFGASSALNYFVSSDTLVMASSPSEAAGTVDVTVTTPSGTSPTSSADQFTYGTATTTSLSSSANPTTYGQSVTLTATVTASGGTPTGTVWFNDGGNVIGTVTLNGFGTATFTTSALTTGSHSITAVYGGDANFFGSTSSALTQTVRVASTTTTLSSNENPAAPGQAVTFTAEVDGAFGGAPTGAVTFYDGSTALGTGTLSPGGNGSQATFTTSTLLAGVHTITAVYGGDANFGNGSSSPLTQTVSANGAYVWVAAVSGDWNTAANWLVNGLPATTAPSQSSDVIFGGTLGTDANCTTDGAVSVHSITIDSNYTGTLDLIGDLQVQGGGFDMENGNINQPNGAASEIDVNGGAFNWAGGNINIGTAQSNLQLFNVTANVAGAAARTFGDNLKVINGTTVNMGLAGVWTFDNGAGINIASGGTFKWNSIDPNGGTIKAVGAGIITNNGGSFIVNFPGTGMGMCDLPYYANAASAVLALSSSLEFTQAGPSGFSVKQDNGKIVITAGAKLGVFAGLQMNGGLLTTLGYNTTTQTPGIVGDVDVEGGTVSLGGDAQVGVLYVNGHVTMNGGIYLVTVDAAAKDADEWVATQGFSLGGTATLTTKTVNAAGGVPAGVSWSILTASRGHIVGDFATKNVTYAPGKNYSTGISPDGTQYVLGS